MIKIFRKKINFFFFFWKIKIFLNTFKSVLLHLRKLCLKKKSLQDSSITFDFFIYFLTPFDYI